MSKTDNRPRITVPFDPADHRLLVDGASAAGISITALLRSGGMTAARAALRDAGINPAEYLERKQEAAKTGAP